MADITLGQFYNAIAQGAREATLEALKDKDFATQTTLAEILSKLSDPATQATLLDVLNKLDDLTAVKNLLTEGDAKVQLQGRLGTNVPDPVVSEIPTKTLTDTFPNNVADLMHSPSNVPMVVDWAVIASNSPFLIILMMPRDAAGAVNRRKTVGRGFVNLNGTPDLYAIRDGYYPGWEIVEWNQEADLYKARFTGPAEWPFGGLIRLQKGGSSPTIQVAATWSYRLMEVVNHE